MRIYSLKYLSAYTLPLTVLAACYFKGWITFLPLVYSFGIIPLIELVVKPNARNLSELEASLAAKDKVYDWLLYLTVPIQWCFVFYYLHLITDPHLMVYEKVGLTTSLGILCGIFGINVGHELGHRKNKWEQLLAKVLLLSSLYMHFFIEHNRGHHKRVSTPADPASAQIGESLYLFWIKSLIFSYLSACTIESERLRKMQYPWFSWRNEMIWYQLIQVTLVATIIYIFGWEAGLYFISAAVIGMLLLETVNYIEHYGLSRRINSNGRYEKVAPNHSWNSNHVIGRMILFELSRHSDHHYKASKKYQILEHHDNSPQMPTGYPGMMLLALVPPVWFRLMHPKINQVLSQAS